MVIAGMRCGQLKELQTPISSLYLPDSRRNSLSLALILGKEADRAAEGDLPEQQESVRLPEGREGRVRPRLRRGKAEEDQEEEGETQYRLPVALRAEQEDLRLRKAEIGAALLRQPYPGFAELFIDCPAFRKAEWI